MNYAKTWLIFDFLAIFPFRALGEENVEYLMRMFRLAKLPKLMNMMDGRGLSLVLAWIRFGRSRDDNISLSFAMKYIGNMAQTLLSMIFLVYATACIWFWF